MRSVALRMCMRVRVLALVLTVVARCAGGGHSEPVWLARSTSKLLDLLRHGFGFGSDKQPKRRLPLFATDGKIRSIVSQTDVLRYVNTHMSLLGTMASATVRDVGLGSDSVVVVGKDEIAVKAFALMKEKHVSALGVVDAPKSAIVDSRMVTGTMVTNLSASDLRGVSFDDFGTLAKSVEHFLLIAKSHRATLRVRGRLLRARARIASPRLASRAQHLPEPVTLSMSNTVADVVHKLVSSGVHRVYIVDEAKHPVRVVSQTDVLELLYAVVSGNAAPVS